MDNLFLGEESRGKIMKGIRRTADAVGSTLGTSGSNSLLEALERPGFYSTNDGFSIANAIRFDDPLEELGRKILLEAINRANRQSGDGSSTTAVLTAAILDEGIEHIGEASPMEIKKSLEDCIPLIEKSINEQKKEITLDEVKQVASISAEDEEIGEMIQEIYQKIGKDGIIQWDVSSTPKDSYTIGNGITIDDCGYVSQFFCDVGQKEIRLSNVPILLLKQKLTSWAEFEKLFPALFEEGHRNLVIFCEEFDIQAVAGLIQTWKQSGFRGIVVRMPVLWRDEWWEDLEIASGGKIVSQTSGIKLLQATPAICGKFKNITIGKESVIIEGTKDLSSHLMSLKVEAMDEALQRVARLNTKTARYFVGGYSESSLAYRRLKVEDAINSASCALDNGVVVGGGIALWNVANVLSFKEIGGLILEKALREPFNQILVNAKTDVNSLKIGGTKGFNSKTGKIEDLMEAGIVDATDVVLNAVKNAIGVAASILTVSSIVLLPREEWVEKK